MLRTVVVTGWVVVVSLESIRSHKLGRLHIRLLLLLSSSSCGCHIASLYRLPRHWVSLSHLPLPVIHVADPIFSFSPTHCLLVQDYYYYYYYYYLLVCKQPNNTNYYYFYDHLVCKQPNNTKYYYYYYHLVCKQPNNTN
jgi:hypothetical protein